MKQKLLKIMTGMLLLAPGFALAHHGDGTTAGQQLLHAAFDPLHLGLTVIAGLALWGLYRLAGSARKKQ